MGWFDRPEYGPNVGLIEDIYARYREDPESVSPAWREFFTLHEPDRDEAPDGAAAAAADATATDATGATDATDAAGTAGTAGTAGDIGARPSGEPDGQATGTATAIAPPSRPEEAAPAPAPVTPPAAPPAPRPDEQVTRLRGAGARIVEAMETSLAVPTATSVRAIPARLLEVNRNILNGHLRRNRRGKVSFTHLIAYAVVKALAATSALRSTYAEVDGKPGVVRHDHVNLGLAVDVKRPDGSRSLLVPNVKQADTLDFAEFWRA